MYRDIGTGPWTKLRLSPTCAAADHHWDTTMVKGGAPALDVGLHQVFACQAV